MGKLDEYSKTFFDHLGESLVEDLKNEIPKQLKVLIEQRFKGITHALEALDRIESENKEKGRDIENLQISFKKIETDLDQLRQNYILLPKKLEDKVNDSMEKGKEELLDAVSSQLEKTPKVYVKEKKRKKWLFF